jgi:hypothetical protein
MRFMRVRLSHLKERMNTTKQTDYLFTADQYTQLNPKHRQAIKAVAEFLTGNSLEPGTLNNETISETFNLLKACDQCVPDEELGDDLLSAIRKKFGAVYQVGLELAQAELQERKIAAFNFCYLAEPSFEDTTHIAILDYDRPVCYLHECVKAWHLGFTTLAELADAVLQVKRSLVEKVVAYAARDIFVVMEGGLVHEVVNLPPNLNVTVIDYDIEGIDQDRITISPLDGELCTINRW